MNYIDKEDLVCKLSTTPDYSGVEILEVKTPGPLSDYQEAMAIADGLANDHLGEAMLLSWYDPQHASECHQDSAIPGYVDYGLSHGASLKIDIENGRFVFFYLSLENNH